MSEELVRRNISKVQKKSMQERKQLESKMRKIKAGNKSAVDILNCGSEIGEVIDDIISGNIINRWIAHMWTDSEQNDIAWNGVIKSFNKSNMNLLINYWTNEMNSDDAEETLITVYKFAADYYSEEISFV